MQDTNTSTTASPDISAEEAAAIAPALNAQAPAPPTPMVNAWDHSAEAATPAAPPAPYNPPQDPMPAILGGAAILVAILLYAYRARVGAAAGSTLAFAKARWGQLVCFTCAAYLLWPREYEAHLSYAVGGAAFLFSGIALVAIQAWRDKTDRD